MNVVSAVANLQKAHDYYADELKDAKAIIKQLTEGPGEIEYIHPYDVYDMLNSAIAEDGMTDIYVDGSMIIQIAKTGKKYKQSCLIPAKSKNFKK
jgi:hypothetical protein